MEFDDYKKQFVEFESRPIGRGGYKEAFFARHAAYGKVVVKLFYRGIDNRASREIEMLSKNSFYHVPILHQTDRVQYNGFDTIATIEQFVEGDGLRQIINSGNRFSFEEACSFLRQALTFVNDIWNKGVVHRDIKPENIIVNSDKDYIFIDFGAARDLHTATLTNSINAMPCTVGYAAPEVLRNDTRAIDSRADLFSVGVVSYELLTGENPFRERARSPLEIAMNTLTVTPTQLAIPGDEQRRLVGLISSMMNRARMSRPKNPQQALAFLDIIEELKERT